MAEHFRVGVVSSRGPIRKLVRRVSSEARVGLDNGGASLKDALSRALVDHTPLRSRRLRKRLVHARRRAFEAVGSARYSRPANHNLDLRLADYLPPRGVYVEAGANDGYTTSNTYYLERFRGWTGVLIEGIPALCSECRELRRHAQVFNYVLVDPDFGQDHATMVYADICSLIKWSDPEIERRIAGGRDGTYEVAVPARTLTDVLVEAEVTTVDFLSLDLEGFEANALRGLDFERFSPSWVLVEIAHGEGQAVIERILGARYRPVDHLTPNDLLYQRQD
jgi:FkbM family methyltransferase